MTTKMILAMVYTLFLTFLASTGTATPQGIAGLLNQLFNSQLQNNKPLVLVLDKSNPQEEQKYPVKPNNLVGQNLDGSVEEEIPQGVYLIQNQVRPSSQSQKRLPAVNGAGSVGVLGDLYDLLANRPRAKAHGGQLTSVGKSGPMSIKKLLRQSECDAADSCADKCKSSFKGKKRKTCKVKCETTFECPPQSDNPEDYDDPCEDYYNDVNC